MDKEEKKELTGLELMNTIVSETLCRHSEMTKEEFFECLKVAEKDKDEKEIVDTAIYNIFMECCKELIAFNTKLKGLSSMLDVYIKQNDLKEN